jgi:hypothetical protein
MFLACPLRVLAYESNPDNYEVVNEREYPIVRCLEEDCSWWNREFEMCSIAVLATTGTTPSNCNDSVDEALRMSTPTLGGDQSDVV